MRVALLALIMTSVVATMLAAVPVCAEPTSIKGPTINGEWQLVAVQGQPLEPGARLTLIDGKLSGSTGCNRFFGSFVLTERTIKVGPVSATKIYCHDRAYVERAYLAALETVTVFEHAGDRLIMHYEPGDKMLEFKR
jgi:heat shock protein HslJ